MAGAGTFSMSWARLLADVILGIHFAYVGFVVFGLAAILIGLALRRDWARNIWLRLIHLAMIGIVVVQAWLGVVCPLTTLENVLRRKAGQEPYPLDFIESWLHKLMFFRAPAWVFIVMYSLFGLAVVATFVLAPPRWPRRRPRES
jgi:hypothetical protein